jgi:hypothetical protein
MKMIILPSDPDAIQAEVARVFRRLLVFLEIDAGGEEENGQGEEEQAEETAGGESQKMPRLELFFRRRIHLQIADKGILHFRKYPPPRRGDRG